MRRRAPFVLHGNFQFAFLVTLTAVVALGILSAAALNHRALAGILEGAAFSAHLSSASSGELVGRAILDATLLAAGASILAGCAMIVCAQWYLEALFRALADGAKRLARGDASFRLTVRWLWWGRSLVQEFNEAAAAMEQRSRERRRLFDALMAAAGSRPPGWLAAAKTLQRQLRETL